MHRHPLIATAAAVVLSSSALLGCSDTSSGPVETAGASSSPSGPAASPAPSGYHQVRAEKNHLVFAVPTDFTNVSEQVRDAAATAPAMKDLARRNGLSPEGMKAQMDRSDVFLMAPEAQHGFTTNVNVSGEAADTHGATPTEKELTEGVENMGAHAGTFSTRATALGDAAQITFTVDADGHTAHGVFLTLPRHDGKVIPVSIYSGDAQTSEHLAEVIARTAHRA